MALPPLSSYSTALVILPPLRVQSRINPLRSTNDKAFPRWAPHLTLLFPFVEPDQLPKASSLIRDALSETTLAPFVFHLDKVAKFQHRNNDTVYLGASESTNVQRVWNVASSALGYSAKLPFVPHLTLGQSYHRDPLSTLLREKAQLLLDDPIQWEVGSIVILQKSESENGLMKIHEEIPLTPDCQFSPTAAIAGVHPTAHHLSDDKWNSALHITSLVPDMLNLATYNVLADPDHPVTTRFPRLLSAILSVHPIPDVICLQEVTDEFLRLLYLDPSVRARWPWCTHDPTGVLPNNHNIIFLVRESLGFSWEHLPLRGKNKQAVILQFRSPLAAQPNEDRSLVIAGVHLTAGLSSLQQKTKVQELETLLAFLRERHSGSPWVLIGDTNIPTSQLIPQSISDSFHDVWLTVHGSEDRGATFDPDSNALASETVKSDRSPQRYDRIFISRDSGVQVHAVEQFGRGPEAASDHYGLTATLRFSRLVVSEIPNTPPAIALVSKEDPQAFRTEQSPDNDLEAFVRQEGGYSTDSEQAEKAHVTAALQAKFPFPNRPASNSEDQTPRDATTVTQGLRFEIVLVGSVGLGVDASGSDVDILVVGNIPPETFWSLARARLRKADSLPHIHQAARQDVILKRFIKDASVPMMELWVGNVQVDLQYCSSSKILDKWDQIPELPSADPLFLLPAPSLRTLNAYRDMVHILRVLPPASLPTFRLAHRALKIFCVSHGIYSSRLGYLGGNHITLLLSRLTLVSPPDISALQLVFAFLETYSCWNWDSDAVTLSETGDKTTYTRSPDREPMVILSVKRPVRNVIQNANKHTANTIISVLKEANQLWSKGVPWADICGAGGVCGHVFTTGFLRAHKSYIMVDLLYWGGTVVKARTWVRFTESRLPYLLVHLQASLPDWNARLWPTLLVEGQNSGDLSTKTRSFYLIGLDAPSEQTSTKTLHGVLLAFEDKLRRDVRFYDETEMFISVSQITSSQLPETITTSPPWSDGGIDPDDTSEDERELEPLDEEGTSEIAVSSVPSKKQKKVQTRQPLRGPNIAHVPAPKLRTSSDVYSRLVWDRELDTGDYLMGYEDRFEGIKETPLVDWKREVEHEAFVPFHRVVHFRRKSDGVVVWDRRKKIDLVFGSGVQQVAETANTN